MIADVDASLRSLLRATALHGSNVDVVFELADASSGATHVAGSVVDAYLWEIREDVTRRQNDWEDIRNDEGRVVGRRPPLHRYRLRYLAHRVGRERPLTSTGCSRQLLAALADEQAIPAEHISGDLVEEGLAGVPYGRAARPTETNQPTDLWGALGIAPRPALDLVVTAPLPRPVPATVADAGSRAPSHRRAHRWALRRWFRPAIADERRPRGARACRHVRSAVTTRRAARAERGSLLSCSA